MCLILRVVPHTFIVVMHVEFDVCAIFVYVGDFEMFIGFNVIGQVNKV